MNLSALYSYLVTKNEVNQLLLLLDKLSDELFKQDFDINKFLVHEASYESAEQLKNLLKDNNVAINDRNALQSFFTQLQGEISSLPMVHLILAFAPKEGLIKIIHDWFLQNFQKTVLLDISIDTDLIGGGVISFDGKANDYSLKSKIDQMQ